MPTIFIPNPNFGEEFMDTEDGKQALADAADEVKEIAERTAPYDPEGDSPHYRDEFVIVEEDGEIRLGNRVFYAHMIEWGTVDPGGGRGTPRFATLRNAAEAAGYRIEGGRS